jgi:formylglycine-generating enzyme required for sulfatase activity
MAYRAFVASTFEDLKDHRAHVIAALRKAGFTVDPMEDWTAATNEPRRFSPERVKGCDLCILLVAFRRGHVPRNEQLSIVQLEHQAAQNAGIDVLVFLLDDDALWRHRFNELDTDEEVRRWRTELKELKGVGFFNHEPGSIDIANALTRWIVAKQDTDSRTAAGTVAAAPSMPTVAPAFLAWQQARCASVELLGLRLKHGQSVRLNNVYAPVVTTAGHDPASEFDQRARRGDVRFALERDDHRALLLHRLGEFSVYVSGDPGTGKSTFCRWVTWLVCQGTVPPPDVAIPEGLQEAFPDSLRGRLPLLVPLRDFWPYLPDPATTSTLTRLDLEATLAAWVDRMAPDGLSGAGALAHVRAGSALVILDGVDEVPLSRRALLLAGLSAALPEWTRGNRVMVTSRPYGLSEGEVRTLGLPPAPIQPLPTELQDALAQRWFHILAETSEAGTARATDMLQQVRGQDWLQPLVANPLLLTAMCIVFSDGKRLPQDKHELYDRLVDVVLYSRFKDTALVARVRDRLSVVAHGMHTGAGLGEERSSPQARATDDEIDRILAEYRKSSPWVETERAGIHDIRDELVSKTGVFVPQGEHRAGFYHLSFQEFFAAQRLADGEPKALVRILLERGESPAWRNTLSFLYGKVLAASTTPERPVRLLTAVIEQLTPGAGPSVVVGADCLEILTRRGYGLAKELEGRLVTLCLDVMRGSGGPRERCEVGTALGRIGDPRFRADAWFLLAEPLLGFVEIPAGPFTMGSDKEKDRDAYDDEQPAHPVTLPGFYMARYPVTVAQFRAYVEDAGVTPGDADCLRGIANHPVVNVSWREALAYGAWLTKKLGEWPGTPPGLARVLDPKGKGVQPWQVTLASEAEWEKAARGTDGRIYPWGPEADANKANYDDTGIGGTSAVGCFSGGASPFGVEDLSGNVWEWTRSVGGKDWQNPGFVYPYQTDDGREDLSASDDTLRVVRGGSFHLTDWYVRAAYRFRGWPQSRGGDIGFRVVVSPFFSEL